MSLASIHLTRDIKSILDEYHFDEQRAFEFVAESLSLANEVFQDASTWVIFKGLDKCFTLGSANIESHSFFQLLYQKVSVHGEITQIDRAEMSHWQQTPPPSVSDLDIQHIAAIPIIDEEEHSIGCICIVRQVTIQLTLAQQGVLKLVSRELSARLQARKTKAKLLSTFELYELITENNQDFIFAKDSQFRLVLANSAFLSLYPPEKRDKVIGFTTLEDYLQEEVDEFLEQDRIAFEKGISSVIEKITFPNGEIRTVHTTKKRFHDQQGEAYILGVSRDVTEREAMIAKLKRSNQELDEFAHIASHDLKSPLNGIKTMITFIEEEHMDELPPAVRKNFAIIRGRVDRMLVLLTDLMAYSQISRTTHPYEEVKVEETIQKIVKTHSNDCDLTIRSNLQYLSLPKAPFEQVISLLIKNIASRYENSDKILHISASEDEQYFQIQLNDNGQQIPSEHYQTIFNKIDSLTTGSLGVNSELGLSMVGKIIAHYQGSITLSDSALGGAKFSIQWPKAKLL